MMNNFLTINTDGGSRGNPGPAASAAVIRNSDGEILEKLSKYLGHTTNNHAEYEGVLLALEYIDSNAEKFKEVTDLHFILDSELVVRQLMGIYKIKHPHIQELASRIKTLVLKSKRRVDFKHVLREYNKDADFLVNQELDRQK